MIINYKFISNYIFYLSGVQVWNADLKKKKKNTLNSEEW